MQLAAKREQIHIVPYDPSWPAQYSAISAQLQNALGSLALRIDHIGSTSVPNLAAKDIIDIQITVAEISNQVAQRIADLGYVQNTAITRDHLPLGFPTDEE